MFCTNCGSEIKDGNRFCTVCGTPVEQSAKEIPVTREQPAKKIPEKIPEKAPEKNEKSSRILVILAVVVGILIFIVAAVAAVFAFNKLSSSSSERTVIEDDEDEDIDDMKDSDEDSENEEDTESVPEETPEAEAVIDADPAEAAALLEEYSNGLKDPTGRDYTVYIKKTDYYDFDVLEVPVGDMSHAIMDYDRDGIPELLVCRLTNDYAMVLDMYEVEGSEVILSGSIDLSEYGMGVNFPGEFVEDIFIMETDEETLICSEFSGIVSLIADGTSLQLAAYKYDGKFSYVNDISYSGSDGEESDSFRDGARELGIDYDWGTIMGRKKLLSDYVNEPHYVGSIACVQDIDYMRFYDWTEYAQEGNKIAVANVTIKGESDESPLPEMPVSEYILEGSNYRYITEDELYGFDADKCRLARNEIYARYGRIFDDEGLNEYFSQFSWYVPAISSKDFKESFLNEYEIYNRDLIVQYEKDMGYR